MDEEGKAIALLNPLPKFFEHLKNVMLYGRENAITLIEVQTTLKTKDMQRTVNVLDNAGEILSIKKFKAKGKNKMDKFRSPKPKEKYEKKETKIYHYCQKPGHLKMNYYSWKMKQNEENMGQGSLDAVQESKEMEFNMRRKWIIDSGCSFHICSHKEWFEEIQSAQGSVLLGNDQMCRVHGIGKIMLRLDNGVLRMLNEVRLIPEIKRNLISL